jgi:hypothetical protein
MDQEPDSLRVVWEKARDQRSHQESLWWVKAWLQAMAEADTEPPENLEAAADLMDRLTTGGEAE